MIEKIKNNKNTLKVFLIIGLTFGFQTSCYFFGQMSFGRAVLVDVWIDRITPFIPEFVFVYLFWFIMVPAVPFVVYLYDKEKFYRYMVTMAMSAVMGFFIFTFYPITIPRYGGAIRGIANPVLSFVYWFDKPASCMPSFHVGTCIMFVLATMFNKKIPKWFYYTVFILSVLVILSTLFIKQHIVYDAAAALITVGISWFIAKKFKLDDKLRKLVKDVE